MKKYLVSVLGLVLLVGCEKTTIEEEITHIVETPEAITDYNVASYYLDKPLNLVDYKDEDKHSNPLDITVVDYNLDGYDDVVESNSHYGETYRTKFKFYLGQPDGTLKEDQTNSNKFEGLVHARKGIVGDFNKDGKPDLFFVGHGYDKPPYPGEYPVLFLSTENYEFTSLYFTELVDFFHTAASGDLDNDGDLDIILDGFNTFILENDGKGGFSSTSLKDSQLFTEGVDRYFENKFTLELYDLDNDGYLDIILGGHEFEGTKEPNVILYNSPTGFTGRYTFIDTVIDYKVTIDIDFYDFDNDGKSELILNRTGSTNFYTGSYIQVVNIEGIDITKEVFLDTSYKNIAGDQWIAWLIVYGNTLILNDLYSDKSWAITDKGIQLSN